MKAKKEKMPSMGRVNDPEWLREQIANRRKSVHRLIAEIEEAQTRLQIIEMGFEHINTGGNCEAWQKEYEGKVIALTDLQGLDTPETRTEEVRMGLYEGEVFGDEELESDVIENLSKVSEWVEKIEKQYNLKRKQ